jgi:hypothetical protein
MLRTVVVLDRADHILASYCIAVERKDRRPVEAEVIQRAMRLAREDKLASADRVAGLDYLVLSLN